MRITEIKPYLMHAGVSGGGWKARNWLFVKIFTDYPSQGNISVPDPNAEYVYFRAKNKGAQWLPQ